MSLFPAAYLNGHNARFPGGRLGHYRVLQQGAQETRKRHQMTAERRSIKMMTGNSRKLAALTIR
jgi:hypothetical protein